MREKLFLTPETESWVISALVKNADVGEGTYSFVLDAEENGYVVKLTCSEADYKALVYFSCTNPHFPVVVKHAANQVKDRASCLYHAVMMEKLITYPPEANVIANHLNGMNNKRNPLSLISTAENINKGKFNKYPISLR
ncbi:hypothetical protein [Paludibacterium denitrificans]|uniref:Uncharacterized protein n=1 Tax=Paludibacterium denitrificans TaxID=2675226 RepID=A0A844GA70_9NEIS|nr:hypothetical protein [Paludibacterium denitrificans]MTD32519.1 hypothetical protein [Paludibacterium denitrificans]